jgi:uncharacterized protein (DUF2132 family)
MHFYSVTRGINLKCENQPMQDPFTPPEQPAPPSAKQVHNPLHGLTLEAIVNALVAHYGWAGLGERIPVRCFISDPSVGSSLKFLRKTPWARDKVEGLYLFMLRENRRAGSNRPPTTRTLP